jgi:hypothetical protein
VSRWNAIATLDGVEGISEHSVQRHLLPDLRGYVLARLGSNSHSRSFVCLFWEKASGFEESMGYNDPTDA